MRIRGPGCWLILNDVSGERSLDESLLDKDFAVTGNISGESILLELAHELDLVDIWADLGELVLLPQPLELERAEVGDMRRDAEYVTEDFEGTGYRGYEL